MLAEAASRSEAGDCDAALILYSRAAETEPALGLPVAQLFDPPTYAEGGCIDAANEDAALEYYRAAADAGVAEAMRRAGEILTAGAASGPVHEEGAQWLQRAEAVESGVAAGETPR
jgi:TPR repeat protein